MQERLDVYERDERIKYRSNNRTPIERPCRMKNEETPRKEKKTNIGQI